MNTALQNHSTNFVENKHRETRRTVSLNPFAVEDRDCNIYYKYLLEKLSNCDNMLKSSKTNFVI